LTRERGFQRGDIQVRHTSAHHPIPSEYGKE
jgi:hypothetical protein